jgi:hypothetical protein
VWWICWARVQARSKLDHSTNPIPGRKSAQDGRTPNRRFTGDDLWSYTPPRTLGKERDYMKTVIFAAAALSTLLGNGASAHHSFAMFDNQQEKTLEGTVKELQWTNPHIWIQVIHRDAATGKDVEYSIEGGSPNNLSRKGWSRNSMKVGDKVVIVIHPLKNGDNGGSLVKVTVNGQTLT